MKEMENSEFMCQGNGPTEDSLDFRSSSLISLYKKRELAHFFAFF
jgi:hypothetical protein